MKSDNLLRDGQSQSRAARVGSAGFIQPVKPFKDGGKLFWRDGLTLVFASNGHKTALAFGAKIDLRIGKAIGRRVFENVVEHARQPVGIAIRGEGFIRLERDMVPMGRQHGRKLVYDLHQHIVQVNGLLLQAELLQIVAGDFKKLIHHFLQPVRLIQRDVHIFGPLFHRHIGRFR